MLIFFFPPPFSHRNYWFLRETTDSVCVLKSRQPFYRSLSRKCATQILCKRKGKRKAVLLSNRTLFQEKQQLNKKGGFLFNGMGVQTKKSNARNVSMKRVLATAQHNSGSIFIFRMPLIATRIQLLSAHETRCHSFFFFLASLLF